MTKFAKVLLFFTLLFSISLGSAFFFLKKLEAGREEQVFLTCQEILKEEKALDNLLANYQDLGLFTDERFADFKKEFLVFWTASGEEIKLLDEISQKTPSLNQDCLTALYKNGQILKGLEKKVNYLGSVEETYKDYKTIFTFLEAKGFGGLTLDWIREKKIDSQNKEKQLENLTAVPSFETLDKNFKKTFRAFVELWSNSEVAVSQKTPVIYSSSYQVFKEDFRLLTIEIEKTKMLP